MLIAQGSTVHRNMGDMHVCCDQCCRTRASVCRTVGTDMPTTEVLLGVRFFGAAVGDDIAAAAASYATRR